MASRISLFGDAQIEALFKEALLISTRFKQKKRIRVAHR